MVGRGSPSRGIRQSYSRVTKVSLQPRILPTRPSRVSFSSHTLPTSSYFGRPHDNMHTPNTEYSPHKRARIATGHELGLSRRALWAKEGIPPNSVFGLVTRYKHQTSGRSTPRSGRPRILSEREVRRALRLMDIDPFIPNKKLLSDLGLTCSVRTLSRELVRRGIQHQVALRRPKLSDVHAAKRLAFARLYVRKPLSWWKRLIVSDESTVARGEGERRAWAFRPEVSKKNPLNNLIQRNAERKPP